MTDDFHEPSMGSRKWTMLIDVFRSRTMRSIRHTAVEVYGRWSWGMNGRKL